MSAGITAVIQSSSATTVMVVGFVNSGHMTLKQAAWIIMGANIGTTVTGQLIAFDIGESAPLITFIGVALALFVKRKQIQFAGGIIAGLGILRPVCINVQISQKILHFHNLRQIYFREENNPYQENFHPSCTGFRQRSFRPEVLSFTIG